MESNYRNRDFEDFIKQNADQYRMFPSEKVWKNIHSALHTRRRWYGFGLALLLLLTVTAVTWVMVSYPVSKNQTVATLIISEDSVLLSRPVDTRDLSTAVMLPFTNESVILPNKPVVTPHTLAVTDNSAVTLQDEEAEKIIVPAVPDQYTGIKSDKAQLLVSVAAPKASVMMPDNDFVPTISDSDLPFETTTNAAPERKPVNLLAFQPAHRQPAYPLTIESVTNDAITRSRKRINWQFYITPTISYRKLAVNRMLENASAIRYTFAMASLSDVNKAVTHKPDMGLQVGTTARYPVTRTMKVLAGLQFNINRYDIKASVYNPEEAIINLNESDGVNSVSTWTSYRNYTGNRSDWLKSFYFSVSMPIGVELRLFGKDKTNFGIAGTIQPTYIIKDRAYLISTDYKNYATVPWLIRHVNVNTGFEAFVNYSSGKTRWQVGPQVRYQVLSSFHNKYPVKENLFDFGMKIGVTINNH